MQFPVPQFTDVEDKIIGPLTLKQFGIIFGAGVVVFLGYSATKSILVSVFLFMLFGVPALGLAFAQINGRPIYNSIGYFIKFFMSPKIMVFHKEASNFTDKTKLKPAEVSSKQPAAAQSQTAAPVSTEDNLLKIQKLLAETDTKEQELLKQQKQI